MKTNTYLLLLAIVSGFFACKKGVNDPEFSIHSRTARLSGEWKVEKAQWTEPGVVTDFDGEYFIITTNDTLVDSLKVTLEYSFDRNGNYIRFISTDYPTNWFGNGDPAYTEELTNEGFWNFVGGNEGIKAKSQLLLRQTEENVALSNAGSAVEVVTYEGQNEGFIYNIDRLAKSEVILKYELFTTDKTGTAVETGELTLKKK